MFMKPALKSSLWFAAIVIVLNYFISAVGAAEPFVLSSPAFKDGTLMPKKFSNNTAGNANCVGENVSPPLNWSSPPAGTKSYALTMVDPEGRAGTGVIHWVAYGIPVSLTGFAEGEVSKPSDKYVGGKGSAGSATIKGRAPGRVRRTITRSS